MIKELLLLLFPDLPLPLPILYSESGVPLKTFDSALSLLLLLLLLSLPVPATTSSDSL